MKIFIAFFLSFSALANFTGKWSAAGFYESDRSEGECREVFLQLKQTDNVLSILDGGYICGDIQAQYPASRFEISHGELFYQGQKVGSISINELKITYLDGVYNLNIKRVEEVLHFDESWVEGDDFLFINSKMKAVSK